METCKLCGKPSGDRDLCGKCEAEINQAVDKLLKENDNNGASRISGKTSFIKVN